MESVPGQGGVIGHDDCRTNRRRCRVMFATFKPRNKRLSCVNLWQFQLKTWPICEGRSAIIQTNSRLASRNQEANKVL